MTTQPKPQTDPVMDVIMQNTLDIFAKNYQSAESIQEQLRTDHSAMAFINNNYKGVQEQEHYFSLYKTMRAAETKRIF